MSRSNQFTGSIQNVIYEDADPESNFAIISVDKDTGYGTAKVKGEFPFVTIRKGVRVKVKGEWNQHPEYGWTMKADWAKEAIDSEEGIRRFLENHVHTIGPKTSEKLITQFGDDLIDILNDNPEKVREEADYLKSNQETQLIDKWEEVQERDQLGIYLYGLGLTSTQASRAVSKLGVEVKERIENDPFELLNVSGIGFQTCNKVASRLKFSNDSLVRIKGTIRWALLKASQRGGHLYLSFEDLREKMFDLLEKGGIQDASLTIDDKTIRTALDELEESETIVIEDDCMYLTAFYEFEDYCSQRIAYWSKDHNLDIDVEKYLSKWEDNHTITLSDAQREAVHALNKSRFQIIAGLPGTGKTTIIKALTGLFNKAGLRFHLMSPTGIAAKRLSNVTGHPAGTIHRKLGYSGEGRWQFNKLNKYPSDAVIVDEASMVSQKLLYHLISALRRETTLVLVGDHAQLPSVGAGNVLEELLKCDELNNTTLTKIFRQEEASDLVLNAHRINEGKKPDLSDPTDADTDFRFFQDDDESSILNGIMTIAKKINQGEDSSYQVLSPRYAGKLGVDSLNKHLRRVLNPEKRGVQEHEFSHMKIREGDRMMVTENDYELEVFNGEIAYIQNINTDANKVQLRFPDPDGDRLVSMEYSDAARLLTLAYCTTIHKCQGQEYDYIIFPFVRNFGIQLQRNLLYTAITRAKKKVFVIGEWSAVMKAVRNEDNKHRNTRLAEKIETYSEAIESEDVDEKTIDIH